MSDKQQVDNQRICFVTPSFEVNGDFRFTNKLCRQLLEKGNDIIQVIQAENDYSAYDKNITIIRVKPTNSYLYKTIYPWINLFMLCRINCDIYHCGNIELLPVAPVLKLLTNKKVVFDFHEDYFVFIQGKPYLKGVIKKVITLLVRKLIELNIKYLDGFIWGDEGVYDKYNRSNKSLKEKPNVLIHHFPLSSNFAISNSEISITKKFEIVYLGTMSENGGIFDMLNAIKLVKKSIPGVKALFIGKPLIHIKDNFDVFISENVLWDNIMVTGKVPHSEVQNYLIKAKIGLIGLRDLPKFRIQSATKLFEYMALGVPIISSDLPPERLFMEDGIHGYFYSPGNYYDMADKILKLLRNDLLLTEMSENCKKTYIENKYYAEAEIDHLEHFYKSL